MTEDAAVARFFSNWAMYRAVIENDCMDHIRIYESVGQILRERTAPFTLADLGCGDAAGIAPALRDTTISRFVGVDSAEPALAFARETFVDAPFAVDLVAQDLVEAVTSQGSCDVVVMAFALHHFQPDEKFAVLADIHRMLNPGGELLLIDLVRQPGQSRESFVEDFVDYVRDWPLEDDTATAVMDHVTGFDFPEEVDTQPRWAHDIGYASVEQFYVGGRDPQGRDTQRGWRFKA